MKLLLVTDAWEPQVNGVVRTLRTVIDELRREGGEVEVIHPQLFRTMPCPTYPEIELALLPKGKVRRAIETFKPDAIHIATEGPLGLAARSICLKKGLPFTTSFHTRFPEYVEKRTRIPADWSYRIMRWFHRDAQRVMVATGSIERELKERGFSNTVRWSRGVDTELFRPRKLEESVLDLPRPIHMYVGRVAVEKNIQAFLDLDLPGSKVVVGDGPQRARAQLEQRTADLDRRHDELSESRRQFESQRAELERKHADTVFVGAKHGEELARHYASADVFVFPSRTDTFGLVMLEALACGLPVAAFPVPGPLDVIASDQVGVLSEDLAEACKRAVTLDRAACRAFALGHSWRDCALLFRSHLSLIAA